MKQWKQYLLFAALAILFGSVLAPGKPLRAATVKGEYTVLCGNQTNCLPVVKSTKNIKYQYVSTNKKIATVHKTKGTITAKRTGSVLIRVIKKPKGKSSTSTYYKVTVVDMKMKGSSVVTAGNKSVYKTNIKNITVKWDVSDETIATISEAGVLTALTEGEVTVIASYQDAIAVKVVTVTSSTQPLKITTAASHFQAGDAVVFTASKEGVQWISSNPNVAAIDKNTGLLQAKAAGKCTVTAIGKSETAAKNIVVTGSTDSRLTIYAGNTNLSLGEERYLLSNKEGTIFTSSNPDVVSIQPTSGKLVAKGYGVATVYAVCGSETAAVQFTVATNGTTLQITSPARVFQLGTSGYFTANKAGTAWFSSNERVGVIDKTTGLFTAQGIGTTTIYAVCGPETQSVSITVANTNGSISIHPGKTTFTVGTYTYLTTNQSPVLWTSSDTNVATIEAQTGLLYAKGVGSAMIYVTYQGQVASIPITVIAKDYTSQQLAAKNAAVQAISNIPNPVTEYNLDSVKTYLTIAKGKIDTAKQSGVSINDITNYRDYTSLLDSWLKIETVAGSNIPYAVQKGTDIQAIETAISAMQSAIATSSLSQRLAAVNQIETSIIRAESTYLLERTEITNYTVYQKERAALGV